MENWVHLRCAGIRLADYTDTWICHLHKKSRLTAHTDITGCTQDTSIQHLHDETLTLPIHEHRQLHASQYKHKTQHTQQTFPQTPTQSLQQT